MDSFQAKVIVNAAQNLLNSVLTADSAQSRCFCSGARLFAVWSEISDFSCSSLSPDSILALKQYIS